MPQNKILVRILTNSNLVLILFILPEAKDVSNQKPVISFIRVDLVNLWYLIPYLNQLMSHVGLFHFIFPASSIYMSVQKKISRGNRLEKFLCGPGISIVESRSRWQ